jgi:acyl-CoA thioester hydrolase
MNISNFKHKISAKVKFHEVDMLGVCNNAVYINYFEDARLDYIKKIGMIPKGGIFTDGEIYFIVHNEINYRSHAHFDDEIIIYTRVTHIKNSSYHFEHLILNKNSKKEVVNGRGVIAHVDPTSRKSSPLPVKLVKAIQDYEKVKPIIVVK